MGTISKNPKSYRLGFRVTEDEYEKILADMKTANYLNTSKYLRACVLNKRIRLERIKDRDTVICGSINEVSKKLAKIGNNYNQVVKALNTAFKVKDRYGNPCISSNFVRTQLTLLIDLTERIYEEHQILVDNAAKVDPKYSNNNNNNNNNSNSNNNNNNPLNDIPQLIRIKGYLFKDAELKNVFRQGKWREIISFRVAVKDVINNQEYTTYYDVESEKTNLVSELKKNYGVRVLGGLHIKADTYENKRGDFYISAEDIKCYGRIR